MSQHVSTTLQCDGCHTSTIEDPNARMVLSYQPPTRAQTLDLCFDCVMAGYWICPRCDEVHTRGPCPGDEPA